jgi:hypothetical protein
MPRKKSPPKKKTAPPPAAAPKPKVFRSPLLDDRTIMTVCEVLRLGVTRECAAAVSGISDRTLAAWVQRGTAVMEAAHAAMAELDEEPTEEAYLKLIDPADLPYAEFAIGVEQAESEAEVHHTAKIHGALDWKASAFWLTKRRRAHYGDESKLRIEHDPATMSNEELISELNELGFVQVSVVQAAQSAAALTTGSSPDESMSDPRVSYEGGVNDGGDTGR